MHMFHKEHFGGGGLGANDLHAAGGDGRMDPVLITPERETTTVKALGDVGKPHG